MTQPCQTSRRHIKSSACQNNINLKSGAIIVLLGLSLWSALGENTSRKRKEVQRLLAILEVSSGQKQSDTIDELAAMGSDAKAALTRLVELAVAEQFGDDQVPDSEFTRAIEKIDVNAALPFLEEKLLQVRTKRTAARLIEKYSKRPVANDLVPALISGMKEIVNAENPEEQSACFQCASALGRIEPRGILALKREMFHEDERVRVAAVRGVPDGKDGEPFVLRLTLRLFDRSATVRYLTVKSLAEIGPYATGALTALKQRLSLERDPRIRADIRSAIHKIDASKRG